MLERRLVENDERLTAVSPMRVFKRGPPISESTCGGDTHATAWDIARHRGWTVEHWAIDSMLSTAMLFTALLDRVSSVESVSYTTVTRWAHGSHRAATTGMP